jgi:hypothetical protein
MRYVLPKTPISFQELLLARYGLPRPPILFKEVLFMRYVLPKTLTACVVAFSLVSAVPNTLPGAAQTLKTPVRAAALPRPLAHVGGAAVVTSADNESRETAEAQKLSEEGPQFPETFTPSDLQLRAFVKGGWPVFIAYELEEPGIVTLQINFVTYKHCPPYFHTFGGRRAGRHEEMFPLPAKYAEKPLASVYTIKAVSDSSPRARRVPLHLRAFGAGPQAVGSSGFEWVKFEPGHVVADQRARASYSFYPIRNFPRATADFMLIYRGRDREIYARRVWRNEHSGVLSGQVVGGFWDCRPGGRASVGLHELYVRGWRSLGQGGDWMVTSSVPQRVLVQ